MSLEHMSDLVGSGDYRRSVNQLYNFNIANGAYNCSGRYTLPRQVVVCFLKCIQGAREEGCIAFSYVDGDKADTRTRDQVSVKARVAAPLAHDLIVDQGRTMGQRLRLLLPHP
jgi:hypothetical protein